MGSGSITLLQVNDVHGYLEPHPELVWHADGARYPVLGGYARLATFFNEVRRERSAGAVLALDNGDTFHGTYAVVENKGEVVVPILNALGLDAMTAHWESLMARPT